MFYNVMQHYMTAALGLFVFESFVTYLFYRNFNNHGEVSKGLLVLVAVVGAMRASISLFLLLIVSMGYGVVTPSLGEKALPIYSLTMATLIFSILAIIFAIISKKNAGLMGSFLSTIPLSMCYSIFVSWILSSLKQTKETLSMRKQSAKLGMYERMTFVLGLAIAASTICLISTVVVVIGPSRSAGWYANHWSMIWFFTDGWQTLVSVLTVASLAWVFRPRAYNRRYD